MPSRRIHIVLLRAALAALFAAMAFGSQGAAIAQSGPTGLNFTLQAVDGRTEFQIGQIIPIQVSFSSSAPQTYSDPSDFMPSQRLLPWTTGKFLVEPANGWTDPFQTDLADGMYFADRLSSSGLVVSTISGSGPRFLSDNPTVITRDLNEFVRFDVPGTYKIRLVMPIGRVGTVFGSEKVTSTELAITIVPPSPAWQANVLDQGRQAFAAVYSPSGARLRDQQLAPYRSLVKALCFLGTPDAARVLVRIDGYRNEITRCLMGSPSREVAVDEMKRLLADPDYAPSDPNGFVRRLILIMRDPNQPKSQWEIDNGDGWRVYWDADKANAQAIRKDVLAAIPKKKPERRGAIVQILLAVPGNLVSEERFEPEEIEQIVAYFGDLSRTAQKQVLDSLWGRTGGPALLPTVREYAQKFQDLRLGSGTADEYSLELAGVALQRWYEMAPEEARPFVLGEIMRPLPRYSANLLGMLPDKTLPQQEQDIARHFDAVQGLPPYQGNAASLVYRYATVASLPIVLQVVDANAGKWPCEIQSPALAYLLRVDATAARPRLEKAIAASRGLSGICRRYPFVQVGNLESSPVLEDLAIAALDDSDFQLAANAAAYLGEHGSAAAEAKLIDRLERWSAQWQGSDDQRLYDSRQPNRNRAIDEKRNLGPALIAALISGHSWLTAREQLQQLRQLAVDSEMRASIDKRISDWTRLPTLLDVYSHRLQDLLPRYGLLGYSIHEEPLFFSVMGYMCPSLAALKEKLTQFPAGSRFSLRPLLPVVDESVIEDLRLFLRGHGYFFAD